MKEKLKQLSEVLKNDRDVLRSLKNSVVKSQNFNLGVSLRNLEKELYPLNEGDDKLIAEVEVFQKAMSLLGFTISDDVSFKTFNLAKKVIEKGDNIDLKDIAEIKAESTRLFLQ